MTTKTTRPAIALLRKYADSIREFVIYVKTDGDLLMTAHLEGVCKVRVVDNGKSPPTVWFNDFALDGRAFVRVNESPDTGKISIQLG